MTTAPVPSITDELLAELEEKAKAATPGPWQMERRRPSVVQPAYPSFDAVCTVQVSNVDRWPDNAAHIAAANPATLLALIAHIRSLETRLEKAELSEDALAERMKAAGMLTVEQMMEGAPINAFVRHAGVVDLDSFTKWVEMRRKEAMALQARIMLDKREDHELFEWAVAHAAVFGEVHVNFKAAIAQEGSHE